MTLVRCHGFGGRKEVIRADAGDVADCLAKLHTVDGRRVWVDGVCVSGRGVFSGAVFSWRSEAVVTEN